MYVSLLLFALRYVSGSQRFGVIEPIKMDQPDLRLLQFNQTDSFIDGASYYIKVSDEDLYLHVYGGLQDGKFIRLHGDKEYAKTNYPQSSFYFEPSQYSGYYFIRPVGSHLYIHAWGGFHDGVYIRLHGDYDYARVRSNSMFTFNYFKGNENDVLIRPKNSSYYFHIWGGSEDPNHLRLHGNINYAKTRPNSQFVLEPACDLLSVVVDSATNQQLTQTVLDVKTFNACGHGIYNSTFSASVETRISTQETVTLSSTTNWNVEGTIEVSGGGKVFGIGADVTASVTAGGGGEKTSQKSGTTTLGKVLTESSSTGVHLTENQVALYLTVLTDLRYPEQDLDATFSYRCPASETVYTQRGSVLYTATSNQRQMAAHTVRYGHQFNNQNECNAGVNCIVNIFNGGTLASTNAQWEACLN